MEPTPPEASNCKAARPNDLAWSALLAAYRHERTERWSGQLIDRLGPWLTRARHRLVTAPPYLGEDDIAQQLVLEVLRIAARWRPQSEDCWIARKLVEAAERRVRQTLARERTVTTTGLDDNMAASEEGESGITFETPIGAASADDLRVIYRVKVLGESIDALAQKAGITPRQMRRRLQTARQRARS